MALLPVGTPLWVPMVVMSVVGVGTGSFMSLVVAVVQGAVPRNETGTITATINLVRQMGSTVATAVIGGVIGVGVAASLPAILDASTLTPQVVQESSDRRAGAGRADLRRRDRTGVRWRSPSPTRSASSPRSCCPRVGCPTSTNPSPEPAPEPLTA